jgi:hypothetical protein
VAVAITGAMRGYSLLVSVQSVNCRRGYQCNRHATNFCVSLAPSICNAANISRMDRLILPPLGKN